MGRKLIERLSYRDRELLRPREGFDEFQPSEPRMITIIMYYCKGLHGVNCEIPALSAESGTSEERGTSTVLSIVPFCVRRPAELQFS
jgi:hypothetical protein